MCWALPSETSERALMTEDRFMSDLLMLQPYRSLSPVMSLVLSEPARSMKWNCLFLVLLTPFLVYFDSICRVNTECERELASLYMVEEICRDFEPLLRMSNTSSVLVTAYSDMPSTYTPFLVSSLSCRLLLALLSRSIICSL